MLYGTERLKATIIVSNTDGTVAFGVDDVINYLVVQSSIYSADS